MQPPPAGAEAPVVVLATPLPAEDDDNAQQQRQEPDEPMSQPETENSGGYVRGVIHEMLSGTAEFAEALLYPAAKAVEEVSPCFSAAGSDARACCAGQAHQFRVSALPLHFRTCRLCSTRRRL